MKKKIYYDHFQIGKWRKPLLLMKLKLALMLCCVGSMSANTTYSQQQKISVAFENKTVVSILDNIKKQTGLKIVHMKDLIPRNLTTSITMEHATVEQVLDKILVSNGYNYELDDSVIIITRSEKNIAQQPVAKQIALSGHVTDDNGNSIVGANVLVRGTTHGVATDAQGRYTLTVHPGEVLVFSFIGKTTVEVVYNDQPTIDVRLKDEVAAIGEVIVTGYQNIKREDATGAFAVVRAESLESRYAGNILENLEGKIPGLVSYFTGLNEGDDKIATIRGVSTFTQSISPLIVVDGLPVEGYINDINPVDIESITVLKDAASASIYGARAANGVIVVVTKKGRSGGLEISASADLTIHQKWDYSYFDIMNGKEQVEYESRYFADMISNPSTAGSVVPNSMLKTAVSDIQKLYYQKYIGNIDDTELNSALELLKKNDFLKEYKNLALLHEFVQHYNLAMRENSGRLNSNFVMNFRNTNSGIINAFERNLNVSYKGIYSVRKWLDLTFGTVINTSWTKEHSNTYATNPLNVPAYTTMFDSDGNRKEYSMIYNHEDATLLSYSILKSFGLNHLDELERDFTQIYRNNSRYYTHLDIKPVESLKLSAQFQYEDMKSNTKGYTPADAFSARSLYNRYLQSNGTSYISDGSTYRTINGRGQYLTFRAQADYSNVFKGRHALNVIAGYEIRETKDYSDRSITFGYDDQMLSSQNSYTNLNALRLISGGTPFFSLIDMSSGRIYNAISPCLSQNSGIFMDNKKHYVSYYGTANYTFNRRYSIFASFRKDMTNLFGASRKFRERPLWSVGAAWNLQNEQFMQMYDWVNMLKLRASFGYSGNIDQTTSSYMTASIASNKYFGTQKATVSSPPNDELRWEKTSTVNIGVDFAFLRNRFSGSIDWYRKYSDDLLTRKDVDPSTGFTALSLNNGAVLNTGLEIMLTGYWLKPADKRNFGWNSTIGIGINNNTVKRVDYEPSNKAVYMMAYATGLSTGINLVEGRHVHSLYSPQYIGIKSIGDDKTSIDDKYAGALIWQYADGRLTYASPQTSFGVDDMIYSGQLDPKTSISLENQFTWRGFSLLANFVFYGGHVLRGEATSSPGYSYGAVKLYTKNAWTPDNPNTLVPGIGRYASYSSAGVASTSSYMQYARCFVYDADFIKLRNLTLGYSFSSDICQKIGIGSLKLRVQGNNLWMCTKNDEGIDPEAINPYTGTKTLRQTPNVTFSLNLTF